MMKTRTSRYSRSWAVAKIGSLIVFVLLTPPLSLTAAPPAALQFSKKLLFVDLNEGCAIADVNRDGHLDIVAGRNWYAGPDFFARPLRLIEDVRGYASSNGDHTYDVNGDGWIDVISGSFFSPEVYWYENPGSDGLAKGVLWRQHLLADTGGKENEIQFLQDLEGNGVPVVVVNSWNKAAPLSVLRITPNAKGQAAQEKVIVGEQGNGHGIGFGDLNGDGREDLLVGTGWYERPVGKPLGQPWKYHPDWDLQASCPMLVRDLNRDGRNDIIWGKGHDFGLYWWEQIEPGADGKLKWKEHLIDNSYSQSHCLHWADLDGDGQDELITGKRKWAHNGRDPGENDPACLYYYKWNATEQKFIRHEIDVGSAGTGLQIRTADLNKDGRIDIVVAGKSGTYILFNQGPTSP